MQRTSARTPFLHPNPNRKLTTHRPAPWPGVLLLAAAISVLGARAGTLSSAPDRFAIEIPASWNQIAPPPGVSAGAQSADGAKAVLVVALEPDRENPNTAMQQMFAGAQQRARDEGMEILTNREMVVGGIAFRGFTARISERASMTVRCGAAGDRVYLLQALHQTGSVDTDSQIQTVLNSFRLLSGTNTQAVAQTNPQPQPDAAKDASDRTGQFWGRLLVVGFVTLIVVYFLRRKSEASEPGDATEEFAGNQRPFQKAFVCGGILFAVIAAILTGTGAENLSYRLGYVTVSCLVPALGAGFWARSSRKEWSWGRYFVTVVGFFLLFGVIRIAGIQQR